MMNRTFRNEIPCPVCGTGLEISVAKGRKKPNPFISISCPVRYKHFRGFIGDRQYVERFRAQLAKDND